MKLWVSVWFWKNSRVKLQKNVDLIKNPQMNQMKIHHFSKLTPVFHPACSNRCWSPVLSPSGERQTFPGSRDEPWAADRSAFNDESLRLKLSGNNLITGNSSNKHDAFTSLSLHPPLHTSSFSRSVQERGRPAAWKTLFFWTFLSIYTLYFVVKPAE